jgi:two-component system sensor histidine kinase/response regulator
MRTATAGSGQAALTILREAEAAGRPFTLVLTDAQMSDLDGFALSEQIRRNGRLAGATIMMLTSGGQRGDAVRCRELGISAHLTKPLMQSELRGAVLGVIGMPGIAEQHPIPTISSAPAGSIQALRILLAEDNVVNQVLVTKLLTRRGHKVTVVGNGLECLDTLKDGLFDLLLLDVQMPEMDGFEAVRKIREMEKTTGNRLTVFGLTAHVMTGDREKCLAAGMDDYLTKPIHAQSLYEAIERRSITVCQ